MDIFSTDQEELLETEWCSQYLEGLNCEDIALVHGSLSPVLPYHTVRSQGVCTCYPAYMLYPPVHLLFQPPIPFCVLSVTFHLLVPLIPLCHTRQFILPVSPTAQLLENHIALIPGCPSLFISMATDDLISAPEL
ncbi:hypothetical protein I79_025673 [Cricetulus griseus]|uniref:Uncharacterized protein n=1 Tax=Cricetulus griseus TaxID=10029 RepID=G3INX7_CRIGR|nr:hypothetical protein I79_025673 [Cricetulus griseus]ERE76978.1 hypothetical protein H671_4g11419 [Cricetulus griseus]